MIRKILKSSSYLISAQILVKLIAFFYQVIFLANFLGRENFGLFLTATSYFALFSAIADFGFNRYLIREGAKDNKLLSKQLFTTIIFRFALTLILIIPFSIFLYLNDPDKLRANLSLIALLAVLPQSIALTLDAGLMAREKFKFSAIGTLIIAIFNALIGVYLVTSNLNVTGALIALVVSEIIYVGILIIFVSKANINLDIKVYLNETKKIIRGSLPYGVLAILGLLYFKVDTLLLSYLKGPEDVALYGAAFKFLEALVIIPSAFYAVSSPILAKFHDQDLVKVKSIYNLSLKIMAGLSIPLFLGYLFILPQVIQFFLPNYQPSVEVIKILSLTIPFMFLNTPAIQVLFTTDKYLRSVIFLSIVTLSFNVILNLIFIPMYGYIAASWITVFSEALTFGVFYIFVKQKVMNEPSQ